jgi:diguanylate cyclase (GGDEF)-like protein
MLPASAGVILILISIATLIKNKKNIESKYFSSLLFFSFIPLICVFLQIIFYGISFMLNGVTISLLILFLNIQNHNMDVDYLTGVYNRKKLDEYMEDKINESNKRKTFSAILIDLNNFKKINDTFGHNMGDRALEVSAKLFKSCLKPTDFIARYGGDEFYIISEFSDSNTPEKIVQKLKSCFQKYNENSNLPFKLSFSSGYAVYDRRLKMNLSGFQKKIDVLMYEDKRADKKIKV